MMNRIPKAALKQKKDNDRTRGGFTLIEIMIVVAIIGVLLSIAVPNFMEARRDSAANTCRENLRFLAWAKEQYAMAENASEGAPVAEENIAPAYLRKYPSCPLGGRYELGTVGESPRCTLGGRHSYP